MLRLWIWKALFYADPTEAVLGVIDDFKRYQKSDDLITLIDFLATLLRYIKNENIAYDEESVITAVENIDNAQWSFVVRGYYGTMLRIMLPKSNYRKRSSFLGRRFVSVARIWNVIQLDHIGCFVPLLLMFGIAFFFTRGLDLIMQKPQGELVNLPALFFGAWFIWSMVNVRTHFSGYNKSIGQQFFAVLVYFGTLLSAIVASIWIRL